MCRMLAYGALTPFAAVSIEPPSNFLLNIKGGLAYIVYRGLRQGVC